MTRRALVTGGSGTLGAAICRRLAAAGVRVIVHANRRLLAEGRVTIVLDAARAGAAGLPR